MAFIERHAEKTIERMSQSFPAVLVTGARQTGKTTLLKNVTDKKSVGYLTFDDPMEEQRVIVVGLDQAQELVAMERGLVVELQTDIARGGLQQHLVTLLGLELADCHSAEDQQKGKNSYFHIIYNKV